LLEVGTITRCYSTGEIAGEYAVGGIISSDSDANVYGRDDYWGHGGLVGYNYGVSGTGLIARMLFQQ